MATQHQGDDNLDDIMAVQHSGEDYSDEAMAIQHHQDLLSLICRICGEKIKKKIYPCQNKLNFRNEISTMYDVDVSSESDLVFPRNLCKSHLDLMYRFRSHDKNIPFQTSVTRLQEFSPHNQHCHICFITIGDHDYVVQSKDGRPKKRQRPDSRLRIEFDAMEKEHSAETGYYCNFCCNA